MKHLADCLTHSNYSILVSCYRQYYRDTFGGGVVTQSCPTLCNPMDVACQAPLSMGFPRQEYWSGYPLPSLGELPDPGTEIWSPLLQIEDSTADRGLCMQVL